MPLIKSKSKKAMSENIKTEMDAGKPQNQSIAVAYAMKRKAGKKKMADGGEIKKDKQKTEPSPRPTIGDMIKYPKGASMADGGEVSASNEKRPMPDDRNHDSAMIGRNSGKKSLPDDQWGDNPTVRQAQNPSPTKLSTPKRMGSDAFSMREHEMRDDESDMIDDLYPESDRAQPNSRDNEIGPNRQGPKISDMERQHNNGRNAYEMAQEDQYGEDIADDNMKKKQSPLGRYSSGGRVEMEPEDHDMELMERNDEMNMLNRLSPGRHGEQPKSEYDEIDADGHGPDVSDMERQHNNGRKPYALGGSVAMDIIRQRGKRDVEDSQADVSRNADEDQNYEDQLSFDALRKENYSESPGLQALDQPMDSNEHGHDLSDEDEHANDIISEIRKRMRERRGF